MPGRSTLTATSRPSVVTRNAPARSRRRRSASRRSCANSARPAGRARARWCGAPRRRETAADGPAAAARSAATSSLRRSARVDSAWPSLMKVGPISCSAAASRSPGRRGSRAPAKSRAQAISAGAMPRISSGNSASWRAKLSATRKQPPAIAQGAEHPQMRQPECRATTPSVRLRQATWAKPAARMRRPARAAAGSGGCFRQITVGLGVAGDHPAEQRQGAFGIGVVDPADRRRRRPC